MLKIGGMKVRRFCPGDEPALLAVSYSVVHQTAARDYSCEQLAALDQLEAVVRDGVRIPHALMRKRL